MLCPKCFSFPVLVKKTKKKQFTAKNIFVILEVLVVSLEEAIYVIF